MCLYTREWQLRLVAWRDNAIFTSAAVLLAQRGIDTFYIVNAVRFQVTYTASIKLICIDPIQMNDIYHKKINIRISADDNRRREIQ